MQLYRLGKPGGISALTPIDAPEPVPGPGQVAVRMRACSLNHRDLMIISGNYASNALLPEAIPVSDGAGEVAAVGPGVTRWKAGDRVAPIFVQRWLGDLKLREAQMLTVSTNAPVARTNLVLAAVTNLNRVVLTYTNSPFRPEAIYLRGWCRWELDQPAGAAVDFAAGVARTTKVSCPREGTPSSQEAYGRIVKL